MKSTVTGLGATGRLAGHVVDAPDSAIRALVARAASMPGCIRLEVGQPDAPTPEHIRSAAIAAIGLGHVGYTPTRGVPALLDAISRKVTTVNGLAPQDDGVLVTHGGTGALAAALLAVCEPGDEVLVSNPYWPTLRTIVAVAGAREVFYPCRPAAGYLPDLDALEAAISPRTKAIVVNSPNNPTGAVYPPETLEAIGRIADRRGVWLISDECYDQVLLDRPGPAPSAARYADPQRTITAMAFSKTYAMTGWRLGYAVAPSNVARQMVKVVDATSSCLNTISQAAGIAALEGPQGCIEEMSSAYRRRLDTIVRILDLHGVVHNDPRGAMYVLVDIADDHRTSAAFAEELLDRHRVAVTPGSAFGCHAGAAVRLSLASADADLEHGLECLLDVLHHPTTRTD